MRKQCFREMGLGCNNHSAPSCTVWYRAPLDRESYCLAVLSGVALAKEEKSFCLKKNRPRTIFLERLSEHSNQTFTSLLVIHVDDVRKLLGGIFDVPEIDYHMVKKDAVVNEFQELFIDAPDTFLHVETLT